jgi:hypothetical protein
MIHGWRQSPGRSAGPMAAMALPDQPGHAAEDIDAGKSKQFKRMERSEFSNFHGMQRVTGSSR